MLEPKASHDVFELISRRDTSYFKFGTDLFPCISENNSFIVTNVLFVDNVY